MSVTKMDYSKAMTGFTKLFGSIVHSTVWREDMPTKVVWITMLALADRNGRVLVSVPGLADAARVPLEDTVASLAKLSSPDEWSRTKQHEGRRIEEIDGGWLLLNYMKYREQRDADERRMKVRDAVQRHREKKAREVAVTAGKHNAEAEAEAEKVGREAPSSLDLPAELDSVRFRAAWSAWLAYRRETKLKRWTDRTVKLQLRELAAAGEAVAVEAIRKSIANGWHGLFPHPDNANGSKPPAGIGSTRTERDQIADLRFQADGIGATPDEVDAIDRAVSVKEASKLYRKAEARLEAASAQGKA